MSFRQSPRFEQYYRCELCQSPENHKPDCPQALLEKLQERQLHLKCPKCGHFQVGLNAHDAFECRNCHAHFSRGQHHQYPGSEIVYLEDPKQSDLVAVVVLPGQGDGRFPLDERIQQVQAQVTAALKEKSKPKRKK